MFSMTVFFKIPLAVVFYILHDSVVTASFGGGTFLSFA